ncbi:MAG: thiamine pyrophosphate-binding protein [Dehalococcoidia bacterium]|nr:thiamine pyrophosphate-binding protein [Dehalococcoidia bacterium]
MSDIMYGEKTVAIALKEEGVDALFGVHGENSLLVDEGCKLGMKLFHVRHEQAAAYAADAYARCLRKPGVVFVHRTSGFANIVPGLYHAKGVGSPIVAIAGTRGLVADGDGMGVHQGGKSPAELAQGICKWTQRITNPHVLSFWVRKAMMDSVQYPQGPITLEMPADIGKAKGTQDQLKYIDKAKVPAVPKTAGDPTCVQKVVEILLQAKRPVVIAGDGVYWSDAMAELVEFAELLQIPTCSRRTARGAVPESHPLAFTPSYRRGFLEGADVICILGHRINSLDEWFEPPDWKREAKYLQVQEVAEDIWYALPTEAAVVGSSKLVLRQMIECARSLIGTKGVDRAEWVEALSLAKEKVVRGKKEAVQRAMTLKPVHPQALAGEIASFLDPTSTIIYDSLTVTAFMTGQVEARYAGQVLDAGMFQTLGHGVGMAIGAQAARPGKQVLVLMGDGGFGIGGMDMETLLRCNLPAVFVLFNNSSWGGKAWMKEQWYQGAAAYPDMLPDIRYDQMFGALGCHTELVTESSGIRPALYRAFNSGRTALINVIGDTNELHAVRQRTNLLETWAREDREEMAEEAQAELRKYSFGTLVRTQKMMRDFVFGIDVPLKELADAAGVSLEAPVTVRKIEKR